MKLLIYVSKHDFNYVILHKTILQDVYFKEITQFLACAKFRTSVMVYL